MKVKKKANTTATIETPINVGNGSPKQLTGQTLLKTCLLTALRFIERVFIKSLKILLNPL